MHKLLKDHTRSVAAVPKCSRLNLIKLCKISIESYFCPILNSGWNAESSIFVVEQSWLWLIWPLRDERAANSSSALKYFDVYICRFDTLCRLEKKLSTFQLFRNSLMSTRKISLNQATTMRKALCLFLAVIELNINNV